jgi:hypothetical protein
VPTTSTDVQPVAAFEEVKTPVEEAAVSQVEPLAATPPLAPTRPRLTRDQRAEGSSKSGGSPEENMYYKTPDTPLAKEIIE